MLFPDRHILEMKQGRGEYIRGMLVMIHILKFSFLAFDILVYLRFAGTFLSLVC